MENPPQESLTHLIGNGGEQGMRDAERAVVFRALAILGAHVVYFLKVSGVGEMHLIRGDAHDGTFMLLRRGRTRCPTLVEFEYRVAVIEGHGNRACRGSNSSS